MKPGILSFAAGSGFGVRPTSLLNARDGSAAREASADGLLGWPGPIVTHVPKMNSSEPRVVAL